VEDVDACWLIRFPPDLRKDARHYCATLVTRAFKQNHPQTDPLMRRSGDRPAWKRLAAGVVVIIEAEFPFL
jgi:hypothetical protein